MDFEKMVTNIFNRNTTTREDIKFDYDSLGNKCIYFIEYNYIKCLSLNNIIRILKNMYKDKELTESDSVIALSLLLAKVSREVRETSKRIELFSYLV